MNLDYMSHYKNTIKTKVKIKLKFDLKANGKRLLICDFVANLTKKWNAYQIASFLHLKIEKQFVFGLALENI